jgi:hypothetical protein
MGYDLHVRRGDRWSEEPSNPITLAEWSAYVARSPDLRMDNVP